MTHALDRFRTRPGTDASNRVPAPTTSGPRRAFTLVEILIVVVILGILASIVVPKLFGVTRDSSESVLREDLRFMREGIKVFKWQHLDVPPGYTPGDRTGPTETQLIEQLTRKTDVNRFPGDPNETPPKAYGPYVALIPKNPINGKSTVLIVDDGAELPSAASGDYGWVYQPSTLTFKCDAVGTGADGVAYYDY